MTACVDLGAEIGFRRLFHLLQDESGDLRRRIFLVGFDPRVAVIAFDDLVGDELLVLWRPSDRRNGGR
jgi:hypothetical protein